MPLIKRNFSILCLRQCRVLKEVKLKICALSGQVESRVHGKEKAPLVINKMGTMGVKRLMKDDITAT